MCKCTVLSGKAACAMSREMSACCLVLAVFRETGLYTVSLKMVGLHQEILGSVISFAWKQSSPGSCTCFLAQEELFVFSSVVIVSCFWSQALQLTLQIWSAIFCSRIQHSIFQVILEHPRSAFSILRLHFSNLLLVLCKEDRKGGKRE